MAPPITIHSDSPISSSTTAQKPDGVTPQTTTSSSAAASQYTPASASATATATSSSRPPQPGAAASMPAPTASPIPPPPTKTLPSQGATNEPPPPQPGSFPIPPPSQYQPPTSTSTNAPPPQFAIPAPSINYAPTNSTETTTAASSAAFSAPGGGHAPVNLAHPPGYQQNPYAQAMTPAQRAAQEEAERREGSAFTNFASSLTSGDMNRSSGGGGGAGGAASGGQVGGGMAEKDQGLSSIGEDVNAAWDKAKSWMGSVAEKVGEMEGEVWKKINKD